MPQFYGYSIWPFKAKFYLIYLEIENIVVFFVEHCDLYIIDFVSSSCKSQIARTYLIAPGRCNFDHVVPQKPARINSQR